MSERLAAVASLALLSACANNPAPVRPRAMLDPVAQGCGLSAGELVQDDRASRLLIIDRADATRAQRNCVAAWARSNGMRSLVVNMQFQEGTSESQRMMALMAAAPVVFTLERVERTELPVINMNGKIHRVLAVTITGPSNLIAPLKQQLGGEGWQVMKTADPHVALISPAGHSLDEITTLSFRINNGEFGSLKFNVTMQPEGKRDL